VADFQAVGGDVGGRDAALGDDEPRRESLEGPVDDGDDGGGHRACDPQAFGGVISLDEQAAGVDDDVSTA
jgi:hypothetical protein